MNQSKADQAFAALKAWGKSDARALPTHAIQVLDEAIVALTEAELPQVAGGPFIVNESTYPDHPHDAYLY